MTKKRVLKEQIVALEKENAELKKFIRAIEKVLPNKVILYPFETMSMTFPLELVEIGDYAGMAGVVFD